MPEKPHSPPFVRERLQPGPSLPTLLSQGEQPSCLPSPSYLACSSAPAPSVALLWTLPSFPVSLLNWGPKTGHYSTGLSAPPWVQWAVHHTILPASTPLAQQDLWTAVLLDTLWIILLSLLCALFPTDKNFVCVAKVNLNAMDIIYIFGWGERWREYWLSRGSASQWPVVSLLFD